MTSPEIGGESSSVPPAHDIVASAVLDGFGARVQVRGEGSAIREMLALVGIALTIVGYPSDAVDATVSLTAPTPPSPGVVRCGGNVVAEELDRRELLRRALSELHLAVAVHARHGLFVHAGAVAWRGVGLVLPGRSMAGKSTLVRALVEAGAEYYSDEYAVLDAQGWLHPYPKPLSIRCADGSTESIVPDSLGAVGTVRVPVGVVVSTRYEPDAVWAPQPLHGAAGVLPLVDNTVAARLEPERMLEATTEVAELATVLQSPRPEAAETASELLSLADQVADRRMA